MSAWGWFAMLGGLAGFAWAVWPSRGGLAIPAPVGGSLWLVSGLVLCAESLLTLPESAEASLKRVGGVPPCSYHRAATLVVLCAGR